MRAGQLPAVADRCCSKGVDFLEARKPGLSLTVNHEVSGLSDRSIATARGVAAGHQIIFSLYLLFY